MSELEEFKDEVKENIKQMLERVDTAGTEERVCEAVEDFLLWWDLGPRFSKR